MYQCATSLPRGEGPPCRHLQNSLYKALDFRKKLTRACSGAQLQTCGELSRPREDWGLPAAGAGMGRAILQGDRPMLLERLLFPNQQLEYWL